MNLKSLIKKLASPAASQQKPKKVVDPAKNTNCSRFEVDGWAISEFLVAKIVPAAGVHPFPLHELMLMVSTVCRLRPPIIFEWGTNIGKSARIFYETCWHFQISCPIHSVDLLDEALHGEHPKEKRGVLVKNLPGVFLYQGDGLATSLHIWRQNGRPVSPLFFVDGDHSYESVKREVEGILAEVPQPSLLLHDTFYQSPESGYNTGPHRAVAEVLAKNEGKFEVIHSGFSLPGMTLLHSIDKHCLG